MTRSADNTIIVLLSSSWLRCTICRLYNQPACRPLGLGGTIDRLHNQSASVVLQGVSHQHAGFFDFVHELYKARSIVSLKQSRDWLYKREKASANDSFDNMLASVGQFTVKLDSIKPRSRDFKIQDPKKIPSPSPVVLGIFFGS